MCSVSASAVIDTLSISIAAILGVLTRVYVNSLFGPDGAGISSGEQLVFYDLAANVLGCFIFGFHGSWKQRFNLPGSWNCAISTGYAGSVTTFASWNYQVVRMLVRGWWLDSLGALFLGICTALCAFLVGRDVGDLFVHLFLRTRHIPDVNFVPDDISEETSANSLVSCNDSNESHERNSKMGATISLLATAFLVLLVSTVVGALLDRSNERRRSFWASSMLAPFGATLRWRLSFLNSKHPSFPVGTFAANMTAMVLDTATGTVLLTHPNVSAEGAIFIPALITGLGGSLSTVSTWLAEALTLSRTQKYVYIMGTIASAQLIGVLGYGSTYWITVP